MATRRSMIDTSARLDVPHVRRVTDAPSHRHDLPTVQASSAILMAERALNTFASHALEHHTTETGAALLGRVRGHEVVVACVVLGGPQARCSMAGFEPDANWQQGYVNFLFDRFRLTYVGDIHRHPGSFDRPSTIDRRTAQEIVTSPEWDTPVAAFPIAVIEHGCVRVRGYLMRRESLAFEAVPIEVVQDTDPRMRAVLLNEESMEEGNHEQHLATHRCARNARAHRFVRALAARLRLPSAR